VWIVAEKRRSLLITATIDFYVKNYSQDCVTIAAIVAVCKTADGEVIMPKFQIPPDLSMQLLIAVMGLNILPRILEI
jgi:hypothetical protein